MKKIENLNCHYAGRCGGCAWIERPYQQQVKQKTTDLFAHIQRQEIKEPLGFHSITSIAAGGLRNRADMTLFRQNGDMVFGLYDNDREDIVDIENCPQMSAELSEWFEEFRSHIPDIRLGSVRLRVSPSGERGAWLDFPNVEIKERDWLSWLQSVAHVEMGQRRKTLISKSDGFGLGNPVLKPWFQTYLKEKALPLYSTIGSFTQPGFLSNKYLVHTVIKMASGLNLKSWADICSGSGNFTFPLAEISKRVVSVEWDRLSLEGLHLGLEDFEHRQRVRVLRGNIFKPANELIKELEAIEGLVVDPPRSGLGRLSQVIGNDISPKAIIYVSCFAKSMTEDIAELQKYGYQWEICSGLDQFPQSPHCEWVNLLRKV